MKISGIWGGGVWTVGFSMLEVCIAVWAGWMEQSGLR